MKMRRLKIFLMAFAVLFLLVGAVNASELDDIGNINDNYDLNEDDGILSSNEGSLSSNEANLSSDEDSLSSDETILSANDDAIGSDYNYQASETEKNFNGTSFSELKDAISSCSKGDTIILNNDISQDGISAISILKPLTIDGNGHTIDAQNKTAIFRIAYVNITLKNIIFTNANGGNIGALEIQYGQCNIINCSFKNNLGTDGGAIYSKNSTLTINLCNFTDNFAMNGGALYLKDSIGMIEFSQFLNNTALNNGGALFLESVEGINLNYSTFFENKASLEGGAIYSNNSNSTFDGNNFINNTALDAGAIYYFNSTGIISNSILKQNIAACDGGALIFNDSNNTIINSIFEFNKAGKKGGAIYRTVLNQDVQCNVSSSTFLNNKAEAYSLTCNCSKEGLNFIFLGWNNYVNAIYTNTAINLVDVTYWNGQEYNSDYEPHNYPSGQNISLIIYDSQNTPIINTTLMTNSYGEQYFSTIDLDDGNYTYKAYHLDDDYYTYAECIGNFTLNRSTSSISLNISDNAEFYIDNCIIPFNVLNRTAVRVLITNVNGSIIYLNDSVNQFSSRIIVNLPSSDEYYKITVYNIPDAYYHGSQDSKLFKIVKATSIISIDPIDDVVFGKIVRVTFNVEHKTLIEVILYGEDERVLMSYNTTNDQIGIPILPVGQYTLSVRNIETPDVYQSSYSTTFNVLKKDNYVNITANDVAYGTGPEIHISADADGNYTLDINGTLYDVEVIGGEGILDIILPIGDYYINGIFDNGNYTSIISNATSTVSKSTNNVFIMVDDTVEGDLAEIKIYSRVNGIYQLDVNGTLMNVSVYNGIGKANVQLPVGEYYANTSFDNENYDNIITNATFRVYPKVYGGLGSSDANEENFSIPVSMKNVSLHLSDAVYGWNKSINYKVKLMDDKGNGVGNEKIAFSINGKTFKAYTNSDGLAVITLSLKIGTYSIKVNSSYGNFARKISVVSRFSGNKNISMYYFDGSKYSFKVYGNNGKLVGANQVVVVKLNKKTYKIKTNSKGIAKLTIPKTVKPGKYTITASYKGQTIKNTITVKKILSSKKSVKVKKTAKKLVLTAKLKKKLKGKKIVFRFRGKNYTAKTDKNGAAKIVIKKKVIKKLKRGKTYKVKMTYFNTNFTSKVKVI